MKPIQSVVALGLLTLVAGCASPAPPARPIPDGACQTATLGWAIGQVANPENGRRLFRESSAGLWRIVMPNQAVPADMRPDRLTINVDNNNIITSVHCR